MTTQATVRLDHPKATATITAYIGDGLPSFRIDGTERAPLTREIRDRIRAAAYNTGTVWPIGRITVTLDGIEAFSVLDDGGADLAILTAIQIAAGGPVHMPAVGLGLDGSPHTANEAEMRAVLDLMHRHNVTESQARDVLAQLGRKDHPSHGHIDTLGNG